MRVGAMSQEYRRITPTIEETVVKLAEIGLDGVELEFGSARLRPWEIDKAKKIKELADSKGIAISNLAPHQDFLIPGDFAKQKEMFAVKASCEMAAAIDVDLIRVQIVSCLTYGPLPSGLTVFGHPISLDQQYSQGVAYLAEAVKFAEDAGVTLGLDNHMFLTVADHLRIVKEIDSPNLKLFQDARNAVTNGEDPVANVRMCGELLVHSHLKDGLKTEKVPRMLGVPVGDGNVIDWEAYLKALKEIGYKGFLSIEGAHVLPMYNPYDVAAKGLRYLRKLNKKVGL